MGNSFNNIFEKCEGNVGSREGYSSSLQIKRALPTDLSDLIEPLPVHKNEKITFILCSVIYDQLENSGYYFQVFLKVRFKGRYILKLFLHKVYSKANEIMSQIVAIQMYMQLNTFLFDRILVNLWLKTGRISGQKY